MFSVIEEFCHPLSFTTLERRNNFIDTLNQVLTYDNFQIQFTDRTAEVIELSGREISKNQTTTKKKQTKIPTPKTIADDEIPVIDLDSEDAWEDATPTKAGIESARLSDEQMIKSKKSQVKELADSHQALIEIVELFCGNPKKPTKQLNDAYRFLVRKIQDIVDGLDLKYYELSLYRPFKNDLYAAEIEWNGDGTVSDIRLNPRLSWDAIRPQLYNAHSNIEKIRNISEETEQMTDDEKRLEEITELISKMRTRKITKNTPRSKPFPIEITNLLPLQFSGETPSQKTQSKFPTKLPAGTQWKNITIRFVDEDSVAILVQGKENIVGYQEMGFEGKGGKPGVLWSLYSSSKWVRAIF